MDRERKNWWVELITGNGNVLEQYIIKGTSEDGARRAAESTIRTLWYGDWSLREAIVTVEVHRGRVTDVQGLPDGWSYQVDDRDICPGCGDPDPDCER